MSFTDVQTDVIEVLKGYPTPKILLSPISKSDNTSPSTAIFIKDELEFIIGFMEQPEVILKTARFQFDSVVVISFLVSVDNDVYEAILDFNNEAQKQVLIDLSQLAEIEILFLDGKTRLVKSITVQNTIRQAILDHIIVDSGNGVWSKEQFDVAKDIYKTEIPDLVTVWENAFNDSNI